MFYICFICFYILFTKRAIEKWKAFGQTKSRSFLKMSFQFYFQKVKSAMSYIGRAHMLWVVVSTTFENITRQWALPGDSAVAAWQFTINNNNTNINKIRRGLREAGATIFSEKEKSHNWFPPHSGTFFEENDIKHITLHSFLSAFINLLRRLQLQGHL